MSLDHIIAQLGVYEGASKIRITQTLFRAWVQCGELHCELLLGIPKKGLPRRQRQKCPLLGPVFLLVRSSHHSESYQCAKLGYKAPRMAVYGRMFTADMFWWGAFCPFCRPNNPGSSWPEVYSVHAE